MEEKGYASVDGLTDVIGYAYPNSDADGDWLIDGFEELIGTDPLVWDTDGDGKSDGHEVLVYDMSAENLLDHGYGDPLDGPRIFSAGFETGDLSQWSTVVTGQ